MTIRLRLRGPSPFVFIASLFISWWLGPAHTQPTTLCSVDESRPAELLSCVRHYLDHAQSDAPKEPLFPDWVKGVLGKLAHANGYLGSASDLNILKQRSTELKRDPYTNLESISLLDSAIAAYADEIGPAISTQRLAQIRDIGTDIYPEFIQQKLDFLGSERPKFYDGGPFEIVWRSLWASSLESEYFLEQKAGNDDKELLRSAIRVLDEVLLRRRSETQYKYLQNRKGPLLNGDRFWRASLLFAVGEKTGAQSELRSLISDNKHFGLEVPSPDAESSRHIYIYKIFSFPHQILVQGDPTKDGARKAEAKDPDIVDRYYNAAQLALCTCAHIDDAGSTEGINALAAEIRNLELSDYYVIAGSADNPAKIQELASALNEKLNSAAIIGKRDELVRQFAEEAQGFSGTISRGAVMCGIKDGIRDQIYSKFDFRPFTAHIEGFGKANEYLLLGGRLNADQANILAGFLNGAIFQLPETSDPGGEGDNRAYVARMRITQ
jgi:hypothetical protein